MAQSIANKFLKRTRTYKMFIQNIEILRIFSLQISEKTCTFYQLFEIYKSQEKIFKLLLHFLFQLILHMGLIVDILG